MRWWQSPRPWSSKDCLCRICIHRPEIPTMVRHQSKRAKVEIGSHRAFLHMTLVSLYYITMIAAFPTSRILGRRYRPALGLRRVREVAQNPFTDQCTYHRAKSGTRPVLPSVHAYLSEHRTTICSRTAYRMGCCCTS